jgi:diguanylate cyclase
MEISPGEDFATAVRRARSAVDLLVQLRIPPIPTRLTIMYLYQTGEPDDLSRVINRLLGHDKLTAQAVDEIHEQYFGRGIEEAELRDASLRIERSIAEVSDCIDTASNSVERYEGVLADFTASSDNDAELAAASLSGAISTVLDETRQMSETNHRLEARLQNSAREIELLREHLDRLEREASLDALTGIANRKRFDVALREAIVHASRDEDPLSLLMIDIDHFKAFNDSYGHQMGDQVLKLVARYVRECVKGQDVVARYGGEEFGVILPRTHLDAGAQAAANICRHVASKKVVNRRTGASLGQITLSIGVAQYRLGEPSGELVHRADEALYLAKSTGRNRVATEIELPAVV